MSRPKLSDSVVVVTGASSGIGRAAALAFARAGSAVTLVARREDALDDLAEECRELGAQVLVAPADVRDEDAVEKVAADTVGRFGRIDVWVNNAATNMFGRIEEAPSDLWRAVVDTNLVGAYHGTRAALPWLREQGSGVIVNVASILSKVGSPYQSAYVSSKHALRALSDCTRQETADVDGIEVCTILPGPVDTPLFQQAGNWTGRRVVPPGPPVDARRAAAAIVRAATRPKREVVVGGSTRFGLLANRLAPGLTERIGARAVDQGHFADDPVPPTDGNVLEPDPDHAEIDGGWRPPAKRRVGRTALVAAAAAAAVVGGRALARDGS